VPDHPFFTTVMAQLDRPLFGTSVNRSGEPPLNNIDQIIEQFGNRVELIVCESTVSGPPSAIIDLTLGTPRALRGELPEQLSPLAR
ncbi:MAG: Sua5/YciO/YrdC/YwlC family protein, partial [Candidatus Bipolaricaulota bacterium]